MDRRVLVGAGVWVLASVGAFLVDPIVGAAVLVFGGALVVVGYLASRWGEGATFEERELARARARRVKYDANAGKRAKDRERWEAAKARKAARGRPEKRVTRPGVVPSVAGMGSLLLFG